jgi:hypothetical protein
MATIYLGKNVLIKIDSNSVGGAGASWTAIEQQTNAKLSIESDKFDASVKNNLGWSNDVITTRAAKLSCDGFTDPAQAIYTILWNAQLNGTKVWVKVDRSAMAGTSYEWQSYVSLSEDYQLKEAVKFTCEFGLQGAPTACTSTSSPSASASSSPSTSASASPSAYAWPAFRPASRSVGPGVR